MNPVITVVSRDIIRKQEPKVTLKYFVENLEIRERLGKMSLNLNDTCALYLLVPSGAWAGHKGKVTLMCNLSSMRAPDKS